MEPQSLKVCVKVEGLDETKRLIYEAEEKIDETKRLIYEAEEKMDELSKILDAINKTEIKITTEFPAKREG